MLAETEGFEPSKELPLYTLSKRAHSTTLPRLRVTIAGDGCASSFPLLAAQVVKWHQVIMTKRFLITVAALTPLLALSVPVYAQDEPEGAPSPNEIVDTAPQSEWAAIPADDLLVMTLAPDAAGNERVVILQLMPAPFSQGWVENIRTLARAQWYDGISVNRVQDNYVVQWGDPGHDNPESGETETKALPEGLNVMGEEDYSRRVRKRPGALTSLPEPFYLRDAYSELSRFALGFPVATSGVLETDEQGRSFGQTWPVHCYGMVGVGRNYSPDTGSGAELYTVIGHAPRHLDRNIALVGRIISGMEHLSSMTRGSGALGFYTEEEAGLRTPIQSIRVASDLAEGERPRFEYLSTEGESFAAYAKVRANRRDPFFIVPAGGADICNIPVPVRAIEGGD